MWVENRLDMSGWGGGSWVACRACASERLIGGGPDGGAGVNDDAATVALGKKVPRAGRISVLRAAGNYATSALTPIRQPT